MQFFVEYLQRSNEKESPRTNIKLAMVSMYANSGEVEVIKREISSAFQHIWHVNADQIKVLAPHEV